MRSTTIPQARAMLRVLIQAAEERAREARRDEMEARRQAHEAREEAAGLTTLLDLAAVGLTAILERRHWSLQRQSA